MKKHLLPALLQIAVLAIGLGSAAPVTTWSAAPLPRAAGRLAQDSSWRWPLPGEPKVLAPFDKPAEQWSAGHRGIDLAAAEGTKIIAPNNGRIVFRSTVVDRPVIVIVHASGFKTSLEPASSDLEVGSWISAGEEVGVVASGAHCSGRCLHWGVRLDGDYIDPALLIKDLRPSILLPLN